MNGKHGPRRTMTVTRGGLIGSLLVLAVAAACVRLGLWQLDRLAERQARNERLEARLSLEPLVLDASIADTAGLSYRRAVARGTYDDDRSIVLPGRSFQGVPGVHLLTPLRLAGGGAAVLVNRGWVPAADAATVDFTALRAGADTAAEGLVLPFPGRGASLAPAGAAAGDSAFRRIWYAIDEAALRGQFPYRLIDVQLQLLPDGRRGVPRALAPPVLDNGPHRGYAIQWFSFAAIAVIGWIALLARERRNRMTVPGD